MPVCKVLLDLVTTADYTSYQIVLLLRYIQGELHRWFENCEMRSIVVANTVEAMPDDKYHHKGGPPPLRP